jgi:hypothetical protein
MKILQLGLAGSAMALALAGSAFAAGPIYGQRLADAALAANPDVKGLELVVAGEAKSKGARVVAGAAPVASPADIAAAKAGRPTTHGFTVVVPLLDASDRTMGALEVAFVGQPSVAKAQAIRDSLKRRVSHAKNLMEPASADPSIPFATYAQHLVDEELAKHPSVVILALHASPPGKTGYPILGSNIGRIGKRADEDDLHVITTGEAKLEYNDTKDRYEVEEAQRDLNGEIIGATGVVFNYKPGDDVAAHKVEADQIESELARQISHEGNLVDPYPYSKFPTDTYAQALVDKTMAAHPDLIILAIHATPPGSSVNIIEGSNIGRIGKPADEDDLRVIDTGSNNQEINKDGKRFEAEVPLLDKAGQRIGALGCVFSFKPGSTKEALYEHALDIRAEMAAQIDSPAALMAIPR